MIIFERFLSCCDPLASQHCIYTYEDSELKVHVECIAELHRGAFCQFPFGWIYYYGSNKSTGKETGEMHFCELV